MTAGRRDELERLVHRLRAVVFEAEHARAEKAARLLRLARARLERADRPARRARDAARRAHEAARGAYHEAARQPCALPPDERGATAVVTDLAGNVTRAFRLRDILVKGATEYVIDCARSEGFTAQAVSAMATLLTRRSARTYGSNRA